MGRTLVSEGAEVGATKKGLMLVHGAGKFPPGYEDPIVRAISSRLGGKEIPTVAVHYTDQVEALLTQSGRAQTQSQGRYAQFSKNLRNEMAREKLLRDVAVLSLRQMTGTAGAVLPLNNLSWLLTNLSALSNPQKLVDMLDQLSTQVLHIPLKVMLAQIDAAFKTPATQTVATTSLGSGIDLSLVAEMVYHYLYDDNINRALCLIVEQSLAEATQKFDEIVLVSHSLGALVTFDALTRWASGDTKVTHWFTLGCPLIKARRLQPKDPGPSFLEQGRVARWFNLYDTNDLVADALGPTFGRPGSYIYDVYVDVGKDPLSAHDYMNNGPTLDMIADALR